MSSVMIEGDGGGMRVPTYNRVSSNWALLLPSTVVAVQSSGQWTLSQLLPRLIICEKKKWEGLMKRRGLHTPAR
jgi:hypothetical protein